MQAGRHLGPGLHPLGWGKNRLRLCQNGMTGEKALPRSPLLLGGGVRGGGEKYGHNLFIINGLFLVEPCFFATTPNPSSPEVGTTWQGVSFILTHPLFLLTPSLVSDCKQFLEKCQETRISFDFFRTF